MWVPTSRVLWGTRHITFSWSSLIGGDGARLLGTRAAFKRVGTNFDQMEWENKLNFPVQVERSAQKGRLLAKITNDYFAVSSVRGRKTTNEDTFHHCTLGDNILYFAVFDGHGGRAVSVFARRRLAGIIRRELPHDDNLQNCLIRAFAKFELELERQLAPEIVNCGSTGVVALLRNSEELVIGHVGDSRAVLCRAGHHVSLTKDHCPSDIGEAERVDKAGGQIITNSLGQPLVQGRLMLTRSFGDTAFKSVGVSAEPDLHSIGIRQSRDMFVTLISDGVSFVMSDEEMCRVAARATTPAEAVAAITDTALQHGSEDNCTALILALPAWGNPDYLPPPTAFSFPRVPYSR